jgi:hypothetical protein
MGFIAMNGYTNIDLQAITMEAQPLNADVHGISFVVNVYGVIPFVDFSCKQ